MRRLLRDEMSRKLRFPSSRGWAARWPGDWRCAFPKRRPIAALPACIRPTNGKNSCEVTLSLLAGHSCRLSRRPKPRKAPQVLLAAARYCRLPICSIVAPPSACHLRSAKTTFQQGTCNENRIKHTIDTRCWRPQGGLWSADVLPVRLRSFLACDLEPHLRPYPYGAPNHVLLQGDFACYSAHMPSITGKPCAIVYRKRLAKAIILQRKSVNLPGHTPC